MSSIHDAFDPKRPRRDHIAANKKAWLLLLALLADEAPLSILLELELRYQIEPLTTTTIPQPGHTVWVSSISWKRWREVWQLCQTHEELELLFMPRPCTVTPSPLT